MLTSIRLQNFKAHRDTTVPLGRFTVLVGPNGTGKTSVLEALLGLGGIVRLGLDPFRYGAGGSPLSAIHNSARRGPIAVIATGDCRGASWQISVELAPDDEKPSRYRGDLRATYGGPSPGSSTNGEEGLSLARAAFGEMIFHHLDARRISAPAPPQVGVPSVNDDGGNIAAVLASLKLADDDRFTRIETELRRVVPNVERIRLRRVHDGAQVFESIHLDFRGAPDLPAYLASEGTLVTLALLTSVCTASGPRTFLLDDLDVGLHPVAQMELVRQLKRLLGELPDVQIVATTHSSYILDEIDAADVHVFALRQDGSVAAKRLSEHPDAVKMTGALSAGQIWTLDPEERWVTAEGA